MNFYAFWVLRGYKLNELAALTEAEKIFLSETREICNAVSKGGL